MERLFDLGGLTILSAPGSRLFHGDCYEVLRTLGDASIDACVTDPPYELGFMGKTWDASGIAHSLDVWREVLRVLKPGGHLLAFGGTRTYHRMVCAIEDAGFEIRDSLHWIFGTGFPKNLNVGEGRGTALKPAHEPIVLARKPLLGTVAENVLVHGTGALNVDKCRIATSDKLGGGRLAGPTDMRATCGGPEWDRPWMHDATKRAEYAAKTAEKVARAESLGRWPANVVLSHLPSCGDACASGCAVAQLDRQSGNVGQLGPSLTGEEPSATSTGSVTGLRKRVKQQTRHDDVGGAARFFYCAKPRQKERGESNDHPTVKPVDLMRWLVRLVTPPGGIVLDPFVGSGTTGIAARLEGFDFLGIEQDAHYIEIAERRIGNFADDKWHRQ